MEPLRFIKDSLQLWVFLAAVIALAGCDTENSYQPIPESSSPPSAMGTESPGMPAAVPMDTTNYTLHVGDQLTVNFFDITPAISPITDQIKEDGTITLIYNEKFDAAGKTIGELQTTVHDRYVPAYVKYMTVNIVPANRSYTVSGEVKAPNLLPYPGHMTVLRAIATAGGFTDFANKRKVQVTRADNRQFIVNCVKALDDPDLDVEIFPGDRINVPPRLF
jgi:polysaccharide biosynthesis/export protein VpsN